MDRSSRCDQFLQNIYLTNGSYLHFRKTYNYLNQRAGTSKEDDSLEKYQAVTSDVITLRSRDIKNTYHVHQK